MQEVKELCDSYISQRKSKNLWLALTFGSTFKNGADYYAGELVRKMRIKRIFHWCMLKSPKVMQILSLITEMLHPKMYIFSYEK